MQEFQSRRQAEWKRQSIAGELERQEKHVLHVVERYADNELHSFDFYFTDSYRAVGKAVFSARTMKPLHEEHVDMPKLSDYAPPASIAIAIPLAYAWYSGLDSPSDFINTALGLYLSRIFRKKLKSMVINDAIAWDSYRNYASQLNAQESNALQEPEKLELTQEGSEQSLPA